ncbi:sensor histidine kinase [Streptomyces sp. KL116D]|uniref:sensor histidine kinase n=1 Tax=Streptomyces sp. KL116D TaxID=3045152 RepID=UPI00355895DD
MAEERLRIAWELHDLVAHQITLANAAGHGRRPPPSTPRPSRPARVSANSFDHRRRALDDLRPRSALLRQSGTWPRRASPPPDCPNRPRCSTSFRRAGLHVSLHEEGTARPLPPGVDLTAYRIVQEALTNVTKHAGTTCTAQVRLRLAE